MKAKRQLFQNPNRHLCDDTLSYEMVQDLPLLRPRRLSEIRRLSGKAPSS